MKPQCNDEYNFIAGAEGDGCDGAGNDVDGDHPITECSGVQWLDGLGGQV